MDVHALPPPTTPVKRGRGRPPKTVLEREGRIGKLKGRYRSRSNFAIGVMDYERKIKLIRLYELVCMNMKVADIAKVMETDESWVSTNIKRLTNDFASLIQTAEAQNIVSQNVAQYSSLLAAALKVLSTTKDGDSRKLSAISTAADIVKKKSEYEVLVGMVKKAPDDLRVAGVIGVKSNQSPNLAGIRDELTIDDLEHTLLEVAEAVKERKLRPDEAHVIDAPA